MTDILDHFPKDFQPREKQKDVLKKIEESVKKGTKFIVIQCPTGTGKSHISATIANYSKDPDSHYLSLINNNKIFEREANSAGLYTYAEDVKKKPHWGAMCLTVSKHLQDQYVTVFENSAMLKGKTNYICNLDPTFTVDVAPCTHNWKIGEECILKDACEYYNDLKHTLKNKFAVLNYSKFLSMPTFIRKREFLICDEASELEDNLVSHFSVSVKYKNLDYYNISYGKKITDDNIYKNISWLEKLDDSVKAEIKKIQNSAYTKTYAKREKEREKRRLKICKNLKDSIATILKNYDTNEYVCDFNADGVTFSPLKVDKLANQLWSDCKHVILMSGTIFDKDTFTRTLGIKKYDYIEVDSEFDKEKSPIFIPAKYSINYKNMDSILPYIIKQAEEIVHEYKDENGIIHTHTNKITSAFEKQVKNKNRYLFRKENITNEHIILEHSALDHPTVLVSPSMAFGVDLPDDLSRFQIIIKMPYPSLGDKRTKKLFERDPDWYSMKMFTKLIQMCGRSTRNENDFCSTYILDMNAVSSIKRNWGKLPLYFKARLL